MSKSKKAFSLYNYLPASENSPQDLIKRFSHGDILKEYFEQNIRGPISLPPVSECYDEMFIAGLRKQINDLEKALFHERGLNAALRNRIAAMNGIYPQCDIRSDLYGTGSVSQWKIKLEEIQESQLQKLMR